MKTIALIIPVIRLSTPLIILLLLSLLAFASCISDEGVHQTKIYVSSQISTAEISPANVDTASVYTNAYTAAGQTQAKTYTVAQATGTGGNGPAALPAPKEK